MNYNSTTIVREIFKDVKKTWKNVILRDELCRKYFTNSLKELQDRYKKDDKLFEKLCPSLDNVLSAFKHFETNELKVVIIGQDPYHTPGVANGLCFSHNPDNNKIQPSLKWIYQAIIKCNYMKDVPDNGDLFCWVKQGVLMLNRYLTTIQGKARQHTFWADFTNAIIKYICMNHNNIIFLLWGSNAQELEGTILSNTGQSKDGTKYKHHILKYGHPSPLARRYTKFENCTHFSDVNEILKNIGQKEINWCVPNINTTISKKEPSKESTINKKESSANSEYIAYTDGSATGNGKANCEAGCAFVLLRKTTADNNGTECYEIIKEYSENVKKLTDNTPTNNIAELFGVIKLLEYLLDNSYTDSSIKIYCDNRYTIDNYNTRVEKWIKAKTLEQRKNPKLNKRMIDLKHEVKNKNIIIDMVHVYSHQKEPEKGTEKWTNWYYNDMVDKLAKGAY